jgi:hypothetical protein
MDPVVSTAFMVAAARVRAYERPAQLFLDPYTAALADEDGTGFLADLARSNGGHSRSPYLPIWVSRSGADRCSTARASRIADVMASRPNPPGRSRSPVGPFPTLIGMTARLPLLEHGGAIMRPTSLLSAQGLTGTTCRPHVADPRPSGSTDHFISRQLVVS